MCDVKKLHLHKKCSTPLEPAILYIVKEGDKIGVCDKCWKRIADGDWEIGNGPKPTVEELFSDKARLGENPVETEYKLRGTKNGKRIESEEEEIE